MSRFPSTKSGHDCVFVVVDRFSKMGILAPCLKSIIDEATTEIFFEHVWVHFGWPQTIISNKDNRFLNTFLSNQWPLMDTQLITFQPQIDGKIEVVNRIIMRILHVHLQESKYMGWDTSICST